MNWSLLRHIVMLAWEKYNYIQMNMQLACVLSWSPYSIQENLTDNTLMKQTIWTDIKAIMFYYLLLHDMNTNT